MLLEELFGHFLRIGIEDQPVEEDGVHLFLLIFALIVDANQRWIYSGADSFIFGSPYLNK